MNARTISPFITTNIQFSGRKDLLAVRAAAHDVPQTAPTQLGGDPTTRASLKRFNDARDCESIARFLLARPGQKRERGGQFSEGLRSITITTIVMMVSGTTKLIITNEKPASVACCCAARIR